MSWPRKDDWCPENDFAWQREQAAEAEARALRNHHHHQENKESHEHDQDPADRRG